MVRNLNANDPRVESNVEVIREYLCVEFKGFEVTEKKDVPLSVDVYRDEIGRRAIPIKDFLATAFR